MAVLSLDQEVVQCQTSSFRGLPEHVIAAINVNAQRLGLSRNEYLLGILATEARPRATVTVGDLKRSAGVFADVDDPDVMTGAWS